MNKVIAPVLASVAALGIVGGVAAAQAFKAPESKPAQVQLVQPAAETSTPTVTVTQTATPSPTTTTVAPAPVKTSVPSKPKATTTAATVQRQAIVSETPTDPTPVQTTPAPAPSAPKVKWGAGGPPTNQVGGAGIPDPAPSK